MIALNTAEEIAKEIKMNVDAFWDDRISYEKFAVKNERLWRAAHTLKKSAAVMRKLPVSNLIPSVS